MSSQAVEVEILGKLTRVNCPVGQEASLRQAAKDLDERLKEMTERTKVSNTEKLLTIAALNVCYELQQIKEAENSTQEQIEKRIEQLTASLDDALNNVNSDS
ncbi:cell division protein ZapA [Vibrio sp. MACH09]|uniref:cell division protein ZapA n=1 Tax=unclassified Vibrio TaxID=2614977 RepID=UPI001493C5E3|nr:MULTISPECIES: cell division protein ZapA [unclassified Vibrio]NOI68373.1 cell division protein ZapA [Vibrio sp. 99-8-1]GLO59891.1 cell division protein ZapA [Vibrio sp. MACH09]